MSELYVNEIEGGNRIIEEFNTKRWVLFASQMQSGKSHTYLWVAIEMYVQGKVDNIVVFSGNNEKGLKEQTIDITEFVSKYRITKLKQFLTTNGFPRGNELVENSAKLERVSREFTENRKVLWGASDLKKDNGIRTRTLFIWDESHFAQNKNMGPDAFLKDMEISPDGDISSLERNDNYLLSVSATPFSEFSDINHLDQDKSFIINRTPDTYYGVKKMLNNDQINFYNLRSFDRTLSDLLSSYLSTKGYIIIRATKKQDSIRRMCEHFRYSVLTYDSSPTTHLSDETFDNLIKKEPYCPVVILIKNNLRMGKRIVKDHIKLVIETSNSSTDVILQSLLGRMCGYVEHKIPIWVPERSEQHNSTRREIDRFVEFYDTEGDLMPKRAKNLKRQIKMSNLYPIVPLEFHPENSYDEAVNQDYQLNLENIKNEILENIQDNRFSDRIININEEEGQTQDIIDKLQSENIRFTLRKVQRENTTYANIHKQIIKSVSKDEPISASSACGVSSDGNEINIWYFKENRTYNGRTIRRGTVFIDMKINTMHRKDDIKARIAVTNKRETFCQHLEFEDGDEQPSNGVAYLSLSPETKDSEDAMLKGISNIVRGIQQTGSKRIIQGHINPSGKQIAIYCTENILKSLRNGRIYKHIYEIFGVKLDITCMQGRPNRYDLEGYKRIHYITW